MAEGWVNAHLGDRYEAHSAGTAPTGHVHPLAVRVMREIGVDISHQRSKSVDEFRDEAFDFVVTLCDDAAENCPVWLGSGVRVHLGFPDPAQARGGDEEIAQAFRDVRDRMCTQVVDYLQSQAERSPMTTSHTRSTLERELEHIRSDILRMGSQVERAIERSVEALKKRDPELAQQIINDDVEINDLRYSIEEECLELIATQQPAASDLRMVIAATHIAVELERMADHAEGTAELVKRIADTPLLKPLIDLPLMAQAAIEMIHAALDAFIAYDAEAARKVAERDDEIDTLYQQVFRELLTYMLEDPRNISRATYLLWVAHNLERIGDRVTNVCERVIFMTTGRLQELQP
jgi:phosphate transport system protein